MVNNTLFCGVSNSEDIFIVALHRLFLPSAGNGEIVVLQQQSLADPVKVFRRTWVIVSSRPARWRGSKEKGQ